jgi:NADH dehydrogenase
MNAHIPETTQKRVVIVGGGFGGLQLARSLATDDLQVVLLDKNNYHQFQPLFYQVATAGLEPSTISFPFRRIFQKHANVCIRLTEVRSVQPAQKTIQTGLGIISYDYLVLAMGVTSNFFGNEKIASLSMPMKSVSEALALRNRILQNFEHALSADDKEEQEKLMNIVVVGGGPTGVEVSGTLAEMKNYILPKDYPELDFKRMQIFLLEGSPKLLNGMSEKASQKAREYLIELGVCVRLNTRVNDYDGSEVRFEAAPPLYTKTLVWAAGVSGSKLDGIPADVLVKGNRIRTDRFNRIPGMEGVFAIGDIAYMEEEKYPRGHPQVAQVAIQQAKLLSKNMQSILQNKALKPFTYKNLGSLATVGRNLAVADLPFAKFQGLFAWFVWMFVHLMSIVGIKNRLFIFINWAWNYLTYDQSLRLIIRPAKEKPLDEA